MSLLRVRADLRLCGAMPPGQIVFSPSSIHDALLLAALGASGETQEEIFRAIGVPDADSEFLVADFAAKIAAINAVDDIQCSVANRLYV